MIRSALPRFTASISPMLNTRAVCEPGSVSSAVLNQSADVTDAAASFRFRIVLTVKRCTGKNRRPKIL